MDKLFKRAAPRIGWRVDRAFLFNFDVQECIKRLSKTASAAERQRLDIVEKIDEKHRQRQALNQLLRYLPEKQLNKVSGILGKLNPLIAWVLKNKNDEPLPHEPQDPEERKNWSSARRSERFSLFRSFIASTAKLEELESALDSIDSLELVVALDETSQDTSLHACMARKNFAYECFKLLISTFKKVEYQEMCEWSADSNEDSDEKLDDDSDDKSEKKSDKVSDEGSRGNQICTLHEYINHRNAKLETVAHLAARNSQVAVFETLNENNFDDYYSPDHEGSTVLHLMYLHAPKALPFVFGNAIKTQGNSLNKDFTVKFNFGPVIGTMSKRDTINKARQNSSARTGENTSSVAPIQFVHGETALLAELVNRDEEGAKFVLTHVLVKCFLEFKWNKMKFWFWSSILLRIIFHLIYTTFVIKVFLIDCRYQNTPKNFTVKPQDAVPDSVLSYLFGNWPHRMQKALHSAGAKPQTCVLDTPTTIVAYFLLIGDGIVFFCKEIIEFGLKARMSKECCKGVRSYASWGNFFQITSAMCIIGVTSLSYWGRATGFHYSAAAIGVIISGGLILQQLGNFFGVGLYIQMLNSTISTFFKFMGLYVVMILAFSIAFSIVFPHEAFQTLPQALSKVLVMMIGEFEYDTTFYGDSGRAPFMLLTGQIILCGFAILLTILLMNLLIGIAVSDIAALQSRLEVIQLTIKVEQVSIMEGALILFRKALIHLQRMYHCFSSCCCTSANKNSTEAKPEYLDIYVIPYQETIDAVRLEAVTKYEPKDHKVSFLPSATADPNPDMTIVTKKIDEVPARLRHLLTSIARNNSNSDSHHQAAASKF